MSKMQQLRALVAQRLTLAAEDIFGVVERTIAEYEEEASRSKLELQRQQNLLDAILQPEIKLHKADHHPPNVSEGNISVKQEELSPSLDYDNLELPQMTDQSRDDVTEFIFSPVGVKSEHDEKQTLSGCYLSTQNVGPVEEPILDRTTQQSGDSGEAPGASSGCQSLPTDWTGEFIFCPAGIKSEHDQKQTLPVCFASTQNAGPVGEPIPDTSSEQRTTQQSGDSGEAPGASSGCQSLSTDWKSGGGGNDPGNGDGHNDLAGDYGGEIKSSHSAFKAPGEMRRLLMASKERKLKKSNIKTPSQSNGGPQQCRVCGKAFTYFTSLKNHVLKHIKDTDVCGICGEHFPSEDSLRLHLQTHVATKACKFCNKHFGSHSDLAKHLRIHTGEKPYICSACGKGFYLNGNLKKHMMVHTGEKPFICTFCGKEFRKNVSLKYHMALHTGQKPHQCHVCGKEFPMKYGLTNHMKIHSEERPYKCTVCGKGCYQMSDLKSHMRRHLKKN